MKIYEVSEGKKWGDTLFFEYIERKGETEVFRFFPRPYNGADILIGFAFEVESSEIETWDDLIKNVLLRPDFIAAYWKRYRNGFNSEKYYYKFVDFFAGFYEDCPHELSPMAFGRIRIPGAIESELIKAGVDLGSYEPNK